MKRIAGMMAALRIAGCARTGPLEPAAGHSLPVQPLMSDHRPSADELLSYTTQARPERVDELMTRSQPRKDDHFDLPPPAAGLAPNSPTAATEPAPATTGPDNSDQPN